MADWTTAFPRMRDGAYERTSDATAEYNCVAWAAGDHERWWWPAAAPDAFWPAAAPNDESLGSFIAAFFTLGYEQCGEAVFETGWERVAIFADASGAPTHAARQLSDGRWTSKLGRDIDVAHALEDLEDGIYGRVAAIMRRPVREVR